MKRTIFLMVLICTSFLCLAGCQKSDTNTTLVGAVNNETQNNSSENIAPRASQPPEIVTQPPTANSDANEIEPVRYPIPEDSQFHGRFTETDDAWMDAEGNIWLGNTQFTFNKEPADKGDPNINPENPVDPYYRELTPPNFVANQMQVSAYPEGWQGERPHVNFIEFDEALMNINSNYKLQGDKEQLGRPTFYDSGSGSVVWSNGVVSVGMVVEPIIDAMSITETTTFTIQAWHTYEIDPTTGEISYEPVQFISTTDINTIYTAPRSHGMFYQFAQQLWDVMALLDTAVSLEDIYAAQRAFN